MRCNRLFGREAFLTVAAVAWSSLAGCVTMEPQHTERTYRPRPAVVRRTPVQPAAPPPRAEPIPPLAEFPTGAGKPALAVVYQQLAEGLSDLASQESLCRGRPYQQREWHKAQQGLAHGAFAPLAAYARKTWAAAGRDHEELARLEQAVLARVKGREITAPLFDGLLWLVEEVAMEAACDRTKPSPYLIARGVLQWATSPELQYHVAFLGLPLSGSGKGMGIWADYPRARGAVEGLLLTPHLKGASQTAAIVQAGLTVDRRQRRAQDTRLLATKPQAPDLRAASNVAVRVDGGAARLECDAVATIWSDRGPIGEGNGVAERGEFVMPRVTCVNASPDEWMMSESLIVRGASPCLVLMQDEVVLPETPAGGQLTIDLPAIYVSGTCSESPSVTFDLVSSHGRKGRVKVDLQLPERSMSAELTIDQDEAGFSDAGLGDGSITLGRRAELGVVANGQVEGIRYGLLDVRPLLDFDAKILRLAGETFGPVAMEADGRRGRWRAVNDLDLTVATASEFKALESARERGAMLGQDPGVVWYRVTTTTVATAPPARVAAARNDHAVAMYSTWRSVSPGLAFSDFEGDLKAMIAAAGALLTPDAIERSVSPSYGDVAKAISNLVKWKLLSGDALGKALSHLDQLKGHEDGTPLDRDMGRRLVIAAAIAGTLESEKRTDTFDVADVLRTPPAESLVKYSDAMLEARVLAIAHARVGARAKDVLPETVAGVRALIAPQPTEPAASSVVRSIPPDTLLDVQVRYLPVRLGASRTAANDAR